MLLREAEVLTHGGSSHGKETTTTDNDYGDWCSKPGLRLVPYAARRIRSVPGCRRGGSVWCWSFESGAKHRAAPTPALGAEGCYRCVFGQARYRSRRNQPIINRDLLPDPRLPVQQQGERG